MNTHYSFKAFKLWALIALLFILSGCTARYHIASELDIPAAQIKKIPLRAGLYMQPEFTGFTFERSFKGQRHVFMLGEALRNGSKVMVEKAFQEAIILSSLEEAIPEKVDFVIIPEIQASDFLCPAWAWEFAEATIIIKWTIIDPEGKIIWVDTFGGESKIKAGTTFTMTKNRRKCVKLAIEDHLNNVLEGILSADWWKAI